jgi:hypothetical protein
MKIIQALTIAALLAGSTVAASADSFFYPTFKQERNSAPALVNSNQLVTGRSVGYSNVGGSSSQIEEPAISPNGNPGLSDFAAHK